MSPSAWEYWTDLGDGVVAAVVLLVTGDAETWSVTRQSLVISLSASVPSVILGVPLGIWMALSSFRGRTVILTGFNTGFGLPPVVVGLVLSILLLRHGPLGWLNLRFTPTAMVIAQFILSCPIMISLTAAAVQQLDPKLRLRSARSVHRSGRCSGSSPARRDSRSWPPTWRRWAPSFPRSAPA